MAHDGTTYPFNGHEFRFRYDDGGETSHNPIDGTWMAAESTDITIPISHPRFRLRYGLSKEQSNGIHRFILAYSLNGAAYSQIWSKTHLSGPSPLMNVASTFVSDWDDTTSYDEPDRLWTNGTWADSTNESVVTDRYASFTGDVTMNASTGDKGHAIEFCLQINKDYTPALEDGDYIEILPYLNGLFAFELGYDATARIDFTAAEHDIGYLAKDYHKRVGSRVYTR